MLRLFVCHLSKHSRYSSDILICDQFPYLDWFLFTGSIGLTKSCSWIQLNLMSKTDASLAKNAPRSRYSQRLRTSWFDWHLEIALCLHGALFDWLYSVACILLIFRVWNRIILCRIVFHWISSYWTILNRTIFYSFAVHCISTCCIALHRIISCCFASHCIRLCLLAYQIIKLHCIVFYCIVLHWIIFRYIVLIRIASYGKFLHWIVLHCFVKHVIFVFI